MRCPLAFLSFLFVTGSVHAELVELKILHREPFAEGHAFGDVGPYERIVGVARFAIDPKHPRNQCIVDLDKAPRNKDGRVEFQADFFMLVPKDVSKGNGTILYDVNNRGKKQALHFFNDAVPTGDLKSLLSTLENEGKRTELINDLRRLSGNLTSLSEQLNRQPTKLLFGDRREGYTPK